MKILFIRFSSIGDIVLTTPVIRCVKKQLHDVEVHFLLKKSFAPVLENNPYINKFYYYDDNIPALVETLKEENYDLIIDLQKNFRSFRIKQLLGIKSFSFDKLNIKKWLFVNLKINLLPTIHIVDRYMKSVSSLGVVNDGKGLDYFITQADEAVLNSIPENHRNGYIAWVIGARHFTKRLPIDKMISISKKINSPIILLGDKTDHTIGEELSKEDRSKIFNACGLFSLNQSAVLVKHAKKVITHDTGLMHIAAAFKKEIISVWGNTVPEFGMYPYFCGVQSTKDKEQSLGSVILEVKNLSCRPCSKIGFEKCPKGHFRCMKEIDEKVFDTL
jgi:ADP-heptose:LPS heptosyltransferase